MVFTKGTGVNHTAWEAGGEDYEAVLPADSVEEGTLYWVTASGVPVALLPQGKQFYAISARIVNVNQYSSAIKEK